jgi:hypothetical protein
MNWLSFFPKSSATATESVAKIANAIAISKCLCGVEIPHFLFGGLIAPARNLVLKTSGTRDGMGIDTSARRHNERRMNHGSYS